jgi:hypothetical protein
VDVGHFHGDEEDYTSVTYSSQSNPVREAYDVAARENKIWLHSEGDDKGGCGLLDSGLILPLCVHEANMNGGYVDTEQLE